MNIFVDVETTGFDPFSDAVLSCAIVTDKGSQVFYSKPDSPAWSTKAEEIHGISQKKALGFPEQIEACESMLEHLESLEAQKSASENVFVYHAANPFDWRMVEAMFAKVNLLYELRRFFLSRKLFSTLHMAKKTISVEKYGLGELCQYFDIPLKHHDALSDATATRELYYALEGISNRERSTRAIQSQRLF